MHDSPNKKKVLYLEVPQAYVWINYLLMKRILLSTLHHQQDLHRRKAAAPWRAAISPFPWISFLHTRTMYLVAVQGISLHLLMGWERGLFKLGSVDHFNLLRLLGYIFLK
jgi:hypothetical protein